MGDQIAGFTLLGSVIAVIFGVLRYRQVRAATRAAAQDRLMQWAAEMRQHTATPPKASAEESAEGGTAGTSVQESLPSPAGQATEPISDPLSEQAVPTSDLDGRLDETDAEASDGAPNRPVDVRAEMDAFFAGGVPLTRHPDGTAEKPPTA